jgi:hypothetical protein
MALLSARAQEQCRTDRNTTQRRQHTWHMDGAR